MAAASVNTNDLSALAVGGSEVVCFVGRKRHIHTPHPTKSNAFDCSEVTQAIKLL